MQSLIHSTRTVNWFIGPTASLKSLPRCNFFPKASAVPCLLSLNQQGDDGLLAESPSARSRVSYHSRFASLGIHLYQFDRGGHVHRTGRRPRSPTRPPAPDLGCHPIVVLQIQGSGYISITLTEAAMFTEQAMTRGPPAPDPAVSSHRRFANSKARIHFDSINNLTKPPCATLTEARSDTDCKWHPTLGVML